MPAYYNENDPKAAEWLRELIKAGLIAPGVVDERSIEDVRPDELIQYTQCHFFAGIGGWSHALRLAGWPDDKSVWTGSCPCQPYSTAGKGEGFADERHLWPAWFWLIKQCRPDVIFGEQVEAAINHGWLDLVCSDLEGEGYSIGAIGLPACGVGAPHIRQRLWFVADTNDARSQRRLGVPERADQFAVRAGGLENGLADSGSIRREWGQDSRRPLGESEAERREGLPNPERSGLNDRLAEPEAAERGQLRNAKECGASAQAGRSGDSDRPNATDGIWRNPDWLFCRDGKWRPTESSLFGLFNGLPDELVRSCNISPACNPLAKDQEARTMRLKGYGNAIVPPLAAEFIKAYMETIL